MSFEVILTNQVVSYLCRSLCQKFLGVATQNTSTHTYNLVIYSVPEFRIISLIKLAHEGIIKCIEFTPNSKLLVSCACDGQIKFWQNTRCIWSLPEISHPQRISIEKNGVYLACANYCGQTLVWNIIQKKMAARFQALDGCVASLQFIDRNDRLLLLSGSSSLTCEHHNTIQEKKEKEISKGMLSIWNWYKQEKLYSIEDDQCENILSLFSIQWLFVCKTNLGLIELINIQDSGDFKEAKVVEKLSSFKEIKMTFICLLNLTKILVCKDNNEISQHPLKQHKEQVKKQQRLERTLSAIGRGKSFVFRNVKEQLQKVMTNETIATQREEVLKNINYQQQRIKFGIENTLKFQQKIKQALFVDQKIVSATEDGTLHWTDENLVQGQRFGTTGRVLSVKFRSDGILLAAGDLNGFIYLSDVKTKRTESKTKCHQSSIDFLNFIDDDQLVSKSKDNLIKIWNINGFQLKLLKTLTHQSSTDIIVSEDQQFVLIGNNNGSLMLYKTDDWSCVQLGNIEVEITAVCFAQGSEYIISANLNKIIYITDVRERTILKKLQGHQDPIIVLASSPTESQFVSGGYDCVINIWSISQQCLVSTLQGHQDCIQALKYSGDGKVLFSCGDDKTIRIWSLVKMSSIIVLDTADDNIQSFDVINQLGLIAYTQHDRIILWQGNIKPVKFQTLQQQQQHNNVLTGLCWSNDQDCLAYSNDYQVSFLQGEQIIGISLKCEQKIKSIQIRNKTVYVTCEDSLICIFDDGILLTKLNNEDCIACKHNNSIFITGNQKEVTVWDKMNLRRQRVFDQQWVNLIELGLHRQIAACCDIQGIIKIWDFTNASLLMQTEVHLEKKVHAVCFARFDQYVVSAGQIGVHMICINNPKIVQTFNGHQGAVQTIALTNDEKNLLTGGEDGTIRYWSVDTLQMIHTLAIHKYPVLTISVQFNRVAYRFGSSTVILEVPKDIITNIQIHAFDCAPLMQTQDIQFYNPNSILSRHLGTIFRPQLKNSLVLDEEIQQSLPYLNDQTFKGSAFYQKIRSHILNSKLRDKLIDQFTQSKFLLQTFDDSMGYEIFNETFEILKELNYDGVGKFVQNMFYTVINDQTTKGTKILQEIMKQQKFSCNLSMKELQYLLALIKFLKAHIALLHNPIKYLIQLEKMKGIKQLNLAKSAYLSSILCKSLLCRSMDKTFETFRLMTPSEMFQNEHFNLQKNGDYLPKCYNPTRADRIEKQISKITELRDKIASFKVDEYDNFIQDFILELLQELEQLEEIDLSFLNLTDEFCEQFCDYYINKDFAPDLTIYSNERITYVGKKYLQVLYTKHNCSSLTVQNVKQMKIINESINDKLKLIKVGKFKRKFNKDYKSQIDLVIGDLTQLQKSVQEKLQSISAQNNQMIDIEDYYEQQCETIKRQQVLLNNGVLGYINEALFSTNQTDFCSFCNKYVCYRCHGRPHLSEDPCTLCLKCYKYHQGLQETIECVEKIEFNYTQEQIDLYQKFKFQNRDSPVLVCFYGSLKCLKLAQDEYSSIWAHFCFRFNLILFQFICFISWLIDQIHIFSSYVLRKLKGKQQNLSQEEMKSIVFESLQVLAEDQFNFNANIFDLDVYLRPKKYVVICVIQMVLWYTISISLPILFPGEQTVQWIAHIIFAFYLVLTLILEYIAIITMIKIVNRPLEGEIKLFRNLSQVKYLNFLIMSTLAKYDYYTDVIFATILYRESNIDREEQTSIQILFYLSLTFIIIPTLITLIQSGYFIYEESLFRYQNIKGNQVKTLRLINFYSKLSYLVENEALAWFLDKFASNTAVQFRQRYVPQKILTSFFKVALFNMPQLIIQLTYQIRLAQTYNQALIFTTLTTCFSLLSKLLNFMSAKSSSINDMDFMKMQQRLGISC